MKERVFVNSALKIQCHVVKNALIQTAFWAILPTGILCVGAQKVTIQFSDYYDAKIKALLTLHY